MPCQPARRARRRGRGGPAVKPAAGPAPSPGRAQDAGSVDALTPGSVDALEGRRRFLGLAAVGGVALAPGIHLMQVARAAPTEASSKVRWGLLVDTTKCAAGCSECVSACDTENGLSGRTAPTDPQWIRKVELVEIKTGRKASLPVMCQHCAEPPCVDVCPTGASFKRADGIVLVDHHLCIGCRYCLMACPYKARSFVHEPLHDQKPEVPRGKGCAEGCTLCVQRIDRGAGPACVEACKTTGHGAMLFGDLNDPQSEIARRVREVASRALRADLALDPGVRYEGL
ncbi:MAG: 4Fe-4S dicluster domain-containing protein [Burkholderiales bacterium]|nr:4Fe-4S dicluster domain-containing protein [Burkholderiales bacterium]MDE2452749.1 4Fe-4S dicluster domain-containing protein [Burkholderiales bacterium]